MSWKSSMPKIHAPPLLVAVLVGTLGGCGAAADVTSAERENDGALQSARQATPANPLAIPTIGEGAGMVNSGAAAMSTVTSPQQAPAGTVLNGMSPPPLVATSEQHAEEPGYVPPALPMAGSDWNELADGGLMPADTPLTLLVVFDSPGSMATQWDSQSRWQAAYASVVSAVAEFQDNLTVGAIMFPTDYDCGVASIDADPQIDYLPGRDFIANWQARALAPNGSTPLNQALEEADKAIVRAAERGLLEHRFRVLLFSDGEPTCNINESALTEYPARWLEHGIRTYVLALPGSEAAATLLDDIANAGGTGPEFGGGPAIVVDSAASDVYNRGASQGASRVVVDDEHDLDDVTRAAAR